MARVALQTNAPANWDSYREAQCQYKKAVRRAKVDSWRRFCESTTMTIKFVEFFIYIKILHVIVKINTVTLEVVPLEFNTLGPASLPLLEVILEFFNRQCLQRVRSRVFNFLHHPPCLSFISFLTLGNAQKSFGAKSGNQDNVASL